MSHRRDSLIMMVIAVALGACYWHGLDRPLKLRLAAVRAELADLREDGPLRAARKEDQREFEVRLRKAEESLGDFELQIPRAAELGRFVQDVSDIAERAGLRDQNITPQPAVPNGSLVVLPIRMDFAARFEAAFAFLRELEELPRVARISALRVERIEPFRGELKAELTIQIFYEAA